MNKVPYSDILAARVMVANFSADTRLVGNYTLALHRAGYDELADKIGECVRELIDLTYCLSPSQIDFTK